MKFKKLGKKILIISFTFVSIFLAKNTLASALPQISTFTLPTTSTSLTVPVTLTATDDGSVTGYMLTETPTAPASGDPGWQGTAPTSYTFGSANNPSPTTWTERTNAGTQFWYSVASSADGTKLVALAKYNYIYTSIDSGET